MKNLELRIPPNGPYAVSPTGAKITLGDGKIVEQQWAENTNMPNLTFSGFGMKQEIIRSSAPFEADPNLRYSQDVYAHTVLTAGWTSTGVVEWLFEYSTDGATWTSYDGQSRSYAANGLTGVQMPPDVKMSSTPALASALTGVEAGNDLFFRVAAILQSGEDDHFQFAGTPNGRMQTKEQL